MSKRAVVLLWHFAAMPTDGKLQSVDGRDTIILHKQEGKWLIVREHVSFPMPMLAVKNTSRRVGFGLNISCQAGNSRI